MKPTRNFGGGLEPNITLTDKNAEDLPVIVTELGWTSCWQLSFWERLQVLLTGKVYLLMLDHRCSPVAIKTKI